MSGAPGAAAQAAWISRVLGVNLAATPAQDGDTLPDGALDDDSYRPVLLKMLRLLKGKERAGFGVALGKTGRQHRMALHPAREPHSLAARLSTQTGLTAITWGVAELHEKRPATIVLSLEGRQLPGLAKKGERMLRAFRPLPFARIVLRVDGQEIADIDDPADEDADDPVSVLPEPPSMPTPQSVTLRKAAGKHSMLCEECPSRS